MPIIAKPARAKPRVRFDPRILAPILGTRLEAHRNVFLAVATLVYFTGALCTALLRPLWFDELFTAHLARLETTSHLWAALGEGVDVTPPLFNVVMRGAAALFGSHAVVYRFPEMVGVWLLSICLFLFVRRRCSILHAIAAMLLPICLLAAKYSTEARPYGLVLGGCGVSLLAWQSAVDGRRRALAIWALAISLAATASLHYYGALFALSIAAGEAVRGYSRKKIDWPVAAALLATPAALVAHWPLIHVAMTYSGGSWSVANQRALRNAYSELLGPTFAPFELLFVILALSVAAYGLSIAVHRQNAGPARIGALRPWETAAVATLLLLPVFTLVVAKVTNGIFTPRYALPATIGFALSLTLAPVRRRNFAALGLILCILVTGFFVARQVRTTSRMLQQEHSPIPEGLARTLTHYDGAIAVNNPHTYLQIAYYLPPDLQSRVYYVAGPEHSRRYSGHDDDDRSLMLLSRWAPINVMPLEAFLEQHTHFLVLGNETDGWLLPKLQNAGVPMERGRSHTTALLWKVSNPKWEVQSEGTASRTR